jgi:hypothetical protein
MANRKNKPVAALWGVSQPACANANPHRIRMRAAQSTVLPNGPPFGGGVHPVAEFLLEFPAWVMVDTAAKDRAGLNHAIRMANYEDKGIVFPVFGDADLAETFIRDAKVAGASAQEIKEPWELIVPVKGAIDARIIKFAAFDITLEHRRFKPIGEFLEWLEEAHKNARQ